MNENIKLKKKKEKEQKKIKDRMKKKINEKNMKRLESYRDFIPYKKKDKTHDQTIKISEYFKKDSNKKIITIEKRKDGDRIFSISLDK